MEEMEYEDAPSGFVKLYTYKAPFMPFKGGFGYEGVILFDGKTQRIQCHLCGAWEGYLSNHLHKEHNMTAAAYKERVGLRQTAALLSEAQRAKLIENGQSLKARMANLIPGQKKTAKQKEKIRQTLKNVKRQSENEHGTCPLQLIEEIRRIAQRLGRTPGWHEMPKREAIIRVYGSYKNLCRAAGLKHRKNGVNINHRSYKGVTKEALVILLNQFRKQHKREPSMSDIRRRLLPSKATFCRFYGSWNAAKKESKYDPSL